MMRVFSAAELERSLLFPELIERLGEGFAANAVTAPLRHHHALPTGDGGQGDLLIMPAWQADGYIGVKTVVVVPDNGERSLPTVMGTYLLLDSQTGVPRAMMDGPMLTARRTAAASALAARALARPNAERLLIVGTGALAPHLASAHCAVRPIREVVFWGRSPANAQRLVEHGEIPGVRLSFTEDLAAAVGDADVISCATQAHEPLIRGSWLSEGTHVDLVGGYTPSMREADDEVIRKASVFVDTREGALAEAGDIIAPLRAGVITEEEILGDLFSLAGGEHPGRRHAAEITVFKSVGTALEDLVAAQLALEKA